MTLLQEMHSRYFLCRNAIFKVFSFFPNLELKRHTIHSCRLQSLPSLLGFIHSRFLDSLSQALDSYLPKMSGFELLKTVYYLCQLGHFPPAPLQQLLQSATSEQFKTTGKYCLSFCLLLPFVSSATSLSHITRPLFFFSAQVPPEPRENVPSSGLVPSSRPPSPPYAPDCPCISSGRPCPWQLTRQAVAVAEPADRFGGPGGRDAAGNGVGGGLLPRR